MNERKKKSNQEKLNSCLLYTRFMCALRWRPHDSSNKTSNGGRKKKMSSQRKPAKTPWANAPDLDKLEVLSRVTETEASVLKVRRYPSIPELKDEWVLISQAAMEADCLMKLTLDSTNTGFDFTMDHYPEPVYIGGGVDGVVSPCSALLRNAKPSSPYDPECCVKISFFRSYEEATLYRERADTVNEAAARAGVGPIIGRSKTFLTIDPASTIMHHDDEAGYAPDSGLRWSSPTADVPAVTVTVQQRLSYTLSDLLADVMRPAGKRTMTDEFRNNMLSPWSAAGLLLVINTMHASGIQHLDLHIGNCAFVSYKMTQAKATPHGLQVWAPSWKMIDFDKANLTVSNEQRQPFPGLRITRGGYYTEHAAYFDHVWITRNVCIRLLRHPELVPSAHGFASFLEDHLIRRSGDLVSGHNFSRDLKVHRAGVDLHVAFFALEWLARTSRIFLGPEYLRLDLHPLERWLLTPHVQYPAGYTGPVYKTPTKVSNIPQAMVVYIEKHIWYKPVAGDDGDASTGKVPGQVTGVVTPRVHWKPWPWAKEEREARMRDRTPPPPPQKQKQKQRPTPNTTASEGQRLPPIILYKDPSPVERPAKRRRVEAAPDVVEEQPLPATPFSFVEQLLPVAEDAGLDTWDESAAVLFGDDDFGGTYSLFGWD